MVKMKKIIRFWNCPSSIFSKYLSSLSEIWMASPKTWVISWEVSQQFSLTEKLLSFTEKPDNLSQTFYFFRLKLLLPLQSSSYFTLLAIVFLPVVDLLFYCNRNRLDIGWNNNDKVCAKKEVWTFFLIMVGLGSTISNCVMTSASCESFHFNFFWCSWSRDLITRIMGALMYCCGNSRRTWRANCYIIVTG